MDRRQFFGLIGSGLAAASAARLRAALPFIAQPALPVTMNPRVVALIQERMLARVWRDSLYPKLLFRMDQDGAAGLWTPPEAR